MLANSNYNGGLPEEWHSEPVRIDSMSLDGARVVKADVVAEENRYRHDSKKLADALVRLYYERHQMVDADVTDSSSNSGAHKGRRRVDRRTSMGECQWAAKSRLFRSPCLNGYVVSTLLSRRCA